MNDTMGPEGLTPTLLIFGTGPALPLGDEDKLPVVQKERMEALRCARREFERIGARLRLKSAMRGPPPNESVKNVQSGDKVLVYQESPKGWAGPYTFVSLGS